MWGAAVDVCILVESLCMYIYALITGSDLPCQMHADVILVW